MTTHYSKHWLMTLAVGALALTGCRSSSHAAPTQAAASSVPAGWRYQEGKRYKKPDLASLRMHLSHEEIYVTQTNGTERPFSNRYVSEKRAGIYVDVVSGEALFSSRDKFESGSGWPSFTQPLRKDYIVLHRDHSAGMVRVEVRSKHADSHLGHVFRDGPAPTGLRYCINSAALRFIPEEEMRALGYGSYLSSLQKKK